MDRAGAAAIAAHARRLLVKAGPEVLRFDARERAFSEAEVLPHLVHEDGFLRVPVLVLDDLVIRGYTEALYRDALAAVGD